MELNSTETPERILARARDDHAASMHRFLDEYDVYDRLKRATNGVGRVETTRALRVSLDMFERRLGELAAEMEDAATHAEWAEIDVVEALDTDAERVALT